MYKSFRVKNFRCFKDLQINDLGRVNLIAGKNNTGKTVLLEALAIYCGDRSAKTLLRSDEQLYTRSTRLDLGASSVVNLDSLFYEFDTSRQVQVSSQCTSESRCQAPLFMRRIDMGTDEYESVLGNLKGAEFRNVRGSSQEFYEPADMVKISYDTDDNVVYIMLAQGELLTNRYSQRAKFPYVLVRANDGFGQRAIANQFSGIRMSRGVDALVKIVQALDPRITDLELLYDGLRPQIYAEIGLPKLVSINHMGDGINRFIGLILSMGELNDGLISIDEIENGIHHSVQCKVWQAIGKLAHELDIQVFATTHSLEMIRAAYEAFKDDDPYEFRYHRLDRKADGNIEAVTYNKYGMDAVAAFDFEHEVRG